MSAEGKFELGCVWCSGPDWSTDQLDDAAPCPKCGVAPTHFSDGRGNHCYLHRAALQPYPADSNFLFIEYSWRGQQRRFPFARLFETTDDRETFESEYCPQCQAAYEKWAADSVAGGEVV